jgi:hypothetical protein
VRSSGASPSSAVAATRSFVTTVARGEAWHGRAPTCRRRAFFLSIEPPSSSAFSRHMPLVLHIGDLLATEVRGTARWRREKGGTTSSSPVSCVAPCSHQSSIACSSRQRRRWVGLVCAVASEGAPTVAMMQRGACGRGICQAATTSEMAGEQGRQRPTL